MPRKVAARALYEGYDVSTEANPERALERLEAEPFDLLISDGEMPEMTGVDLIARARALHPHLRFLMVSGNISAARRIWLEASSIGYLDKPYAIDDLRQRVAQALV